MSFTPYILTQKPVAAEKLISFPSYISITYDSTPLNQPLQIDVAIGVPVTITFWTDIPQGFNKIPFFAIRNIILFGNPVAVQEKIHLNITNAPNWANIYFSTPDILIPSIPFQGETPETQNVTLIISPKIEAPAEPQNIAITASSDAMKRLKGYVYSINIPFQPTFLPTIAITPENPIRTVGPHESVTFHITVLNNGNKATRVTPTIANPNSDWTPTINPPLYEIQPNQEQVFSFSVITPYNFGWHNEYQSFQVRFYAEAFPFTQGAPSTNQTIYLVLNNHGFSMPGFELVLVLIALLSVVFVIKKRRGKN